MKTGKNSAVHLEQEASAFAGFSDVGRGVPASLLAHFYQSRHWVLSNHLKKEDAVSME